jgi:hypothetical protein
MRPDDSQIDDVKQRLARTRWPDPETVGHCLAGPVVKAVGEPVDVLGSVRGWLACTGMLDAICLYWFTNITTALGAMQPEGLVGIHLNTQYAFPAQIRLPEIIRTARRAPCIDWLNQWFDPPRSPV